MKHFRVKNSIILFIGIALLVVVAISMTACSPQLSVDNLYPAVAVVEEVNHDSDFVYCLDYNGEAWCFDGAEDWFAGDIVAMLVYDNGTDDRIVSVRYAGSVAVG